MDKTDRLLKDFLKTRILQRANNSSISLCPSEEILIEYINGAQEDDDTGEHISGCPYCLEAMMLVKEMDKFSHHKIEGPSRALKDRIKAMALKKNPALHKNWFKKNMWFVFSLVSLSLSFIFPKHFLQFLVLSLILGARWVFDTATTRTMVIIYEALKKHSRFTSNHEDTNLRKS